MSAVAIESRRSIRNGIRSGVVAALLLVGLIGGWASTTELSGAVVASGILVVDTNVKKVQHPTGGIVGGLNIRDVRE